MTDLREHLLLTKKCTRPSPASDAAANKSPNIKERLNLHVKKRLQQELPHQLMPIQQQLPFQQTAPASEAHMGPHSAVKLKQKDPPKARRPYQKRADKTKLVNNNSATEGGSVGPPTVRKYKRHKMRQSSQLSSAPASGSTVIVGSAFIAGAIGAISDESTVTHFENMVEDDCSQDGAGLEGDGRNGAAGRDKEKCPDVLGLVVSMKKQTLLQHPEVQEFLHQMMDAIKN